MSNTTHKICENCGLAFRNSPKSAGCDSPDHERGHKILNRLYSYLPTKAVEGPDGKITYDVCADDLFRLTMDLTPREYVVCSSCGRTFNINPTKLNCDSPDHKIKYRSNLNERMTRHTNSIKFGGATPDKIVMIHPEVDLSDTSLPDLVIYFGRRVKWSNPVTKLYLFDSSKKLAWGTSNTLRFRSARETGDSDIKEVVIPALSIKRLEPPLTLEDLGFKENVRLGLFTYVPPATKGVKVS